MRVATEPTELPDALEMPLLPIVNADPEPEERALETSVALLVDAVNAPKDVEEVSEPKPEVSDTEEPIPLLDALRVPLVRAAVVNIELEVLVAGRLVE